MATAAAIEAARRVAASEADWSCSANPTRGVSDRKAVLLSVNHSGDCDSTGAGLPRGLPARKHGPVERYALRSW